MGWVKQLFDSRAAMALQRSIELGVFRGVSHMVIIKLHRELRLGTRDLANARVLTHNECKRRC